MPTRKELKSRGRRLLRKHFFLFVFLCLFAGYIGAEYTTSIESMHDSSVENAGSMTPSTDIGLKSIYTFVLKDRITKTTKTASKYIENRQLPHLSVSKKSFHKFAAETLNELSSGAFLLTLYKGVLSIAGSKSNATILGIFLCLLMCLFLWVFFINIFRAIMRRIYLESREYELLSTQRVLHLFRNKKLFRASYTMLITYIYQLLWDFTIIGGIIKRYSYFAIPYIVAENPTIPLKDAIQLSRDMMYGHKWECCKMELSFVGWWVLNIVTFGASGILYSNPFQQAVYCEYFVELRALAFQNNVPNIEYFNDIYLYEHADEELLHDTYAHLIEDAEYPDELGSTGFRALFANWFGMTVARSEHQTDLKDSMEHAISQERYQNALSHKVYPYYLGPNFVPPRKKNTEASYYMRRYSFFSLVLMFFLFSMFGWAWEVCLHFVEDGVFVNRGTLHGPWLPIYGGGTFLILVLLYRFRHFPVLQFFTTVALCGVVEFFTSYILEITNNGKKWWDYTGYFLNIQGRICAEGLLAFGIGGIAIVYLVAPIMDDLIRKIPKGIVITLCILLLLLLSCDLVYSAIHPNTGLGITDYDTATTQQQIPGGAP